MTEQRQTPPEWTAYWTLAAGRGALRTEPARDPGPHEALVRTLRSGISRGTELLVHRGQVPPTVAEAMRAPFQVGDWPGPVKYGYLSVGVVESGPGPLRGRRVFCLHPHQDRYVVPVEALVAVPDPVPTDRAVLAGTVETALNAAWDAGPRIGDRVAVVGAGMVGAAVAAVLRVLPLERLQLVDVEESRAALAGALGVEFATPDQAADGCDLVFHCSATGSGLARGLELLGVEGELVELSWYGTSVPAVPLGGPFHARRLTIRASQVGRVATARRARRTPADRLRLAMSQLVDPAYDALLQDHVRFADLPAYLADLGDRPGTLCTIVDYPDA